MKGFLNIKRSWSEGDEIILVSETGGQVGEPVELFSLLGNHFGNKVIAKGVVSSVCASEEAAPIAPTTTGRPFKNAWRDYYRVKIKEILP
jgi:hypothetical protein